jgi:hypothetical protein
MDEYFQAPMTAATVREALDYLYGRAVCSCERGEPSIETSGQHDDGLAALAALEERLQAVNESLAIQSGRFAEFRRDLELKLAKAAGGS